MDEALILAHPEALPSDLLRKMTKLLAEPPSGTAPLILCSSQAQFQELRDHLQSLFQSIPAP